MNTRPVPVLQVLVFLTLIAVCGTSAWGVPSVMDYQGKLTDSAGSPLTGTYSMSFRLYGAGVGGTHLWQESRSVQALDGIYSVLLGAVTPLPAAVFASDNLYLEVQVGTEVLSPRQRLVSTAFAMRAGDAETLNGLDAGDFSPGTHVHSFPQITGTASDAQVPNNITIDHAAWAGNCDTVDGQHAAAFSPSSHNHDGAHITTGTVADARIATTITRNSQLVGYYSKAEVDAKVTALQSQITAQQAQIVALQGAMSNLVSIFQANISRSGDDIVFSGVNVHVVSGGGTTDAPPTGYGNLIIGYNEPRGSGDDRSGSHNLIIGKNHNYSSYGGLVAGAQNTISGPYATVSGGFVNTASGLYASVSGGWNNTAGAIRASVSGGNGVSATIVDSWAAGTYHSP
jgi:hypothetical protein